MSPEILGLLLIGCMLFAIFIGYPISFTLIFLGFVFGYIGFGDLVFYLMTLRELIARKALEESPHTRPDRSSTPLPALYRVK